VGLEEGPLSHTEISSSSEYESESETSTGSALPLYTSSPPTPPPPPPSTTSPIDSPPSYNINMSQINLHKIIRQQQEQLAAIQAQIQALLAAQGAGAGREAMGSNMGSHMEVAKPAIFNGEAAKVGGFITACRLFLRMKMRGSTVEEQVQWVLSYVQGRSADIWKENVMEEMEAGKVEYESAEEFLTCLRKEFGGGEEKSVKVAELRKLEQGGRTMEKFVQEEVDMRGGH